jgi:acyl-CoA thioesterase I
MEQPVLRTAALALAAALLALAACDKPAGPAPTGAASGAPSPRPPAGPEKLVVALGDSLFAGYNLKPGEAWPAKLEKALWARGINARVVNGGVSGDTTAAGRQRLSFLLDNQPRLPDLVIVGLGANDMLRGLPPAQARANLEAILGELDRRKIPAVLTGMLAAPNFGPDYAREFNTIYPTLAKRHDAGLVPFFMAPVIGKPDLLQPDHLHPTAQGVDAIVAGSVDEVAEALQAGGGR